MKRTLPVALLLALVYLLFFITPHLDHSSRASHAFVSFLILSVNAAIALSWIEFGIVTNVALTLFLSVVGLVGAVKSGYFFSATLCWSYIAAVLVGYTYWYSKDKSNRMFEFKYEKLDEDINILSEELHKKKDDITHLEGKLLRYLVLKDVTEVLTSTLSLDDIASILIERASNILQKDGRVMLYLVDVEKQELMLSASKGTLGVKEKKGDVFDSWVLKHGIPLMVEDVANDFRFSGPEVAVARGHCRSIIISPLLSAEKIIGIFRMDSPKSFSYTQDDLRLLNIIGDLGAVAIQNAFLYSCVQDLAIRDSLTGLFVRRYFMKRFEEEIKRASRKSAPMSLLMLDIDHFKSYNDKFGHATGDLVLKYFAQVIKTSINEGDIAARYGGEEIAVLLTGAGVEEAKKISESIRKKIEDMPFVLRREKQNLTVSIGISNYPKDTASVEEMIRVADARLYKAKESGRNRTCEK